MEKKLFKAGEVVFVEGSVANSMFKIESGEVKVVARYGTDSELEVATMGQGKYFGEMGVVDNTTRSATIIAKTDLELSEITSSAFSAFIASNPEVAIGIMQNLSKALRATTNDYIDACKTIAEVMNEEDNQPKKDGVWEKLKKFASLYAEACAELNNSTLNDTPTLYSQFYGHYNLY